MEYGEILNILAPCGLNCKKCMANADGDIKRHSTALKELLASFDNYAKRFSKFWPVFENYPQFKNLLDHFTQGNCLGCRKGDCKYPNWGWPLAINRRGLISVFNVMNSPAKRQTSTLISRKDGLR